VAIQLKHTGVLETTKIRRLGYSNRIIFNEFVKRYSVLLWPFGANVSQTKETCKEMLEQLGFKNWKIGKTKVFLKYYHAEQLTRLYQQLNKKIILVQSFIRSWLARRTYVKTKNDYERSAHLIQKSNFRSFCIIFVAQTSLIFFRYTLQSISKLYEKEAHQKAFFAVCRLFASAYTWLLSP
jgi:myosin heavy subunit